MIQIHCHYQDSVPIQDLKPFPQNRNKHGQDQIDRLAKLIQYQGCRAPIVVSKLSGYIVKGHGTLEALKQLGMKEVPVVYQEFESTDQEYAFVQSDNSIALWAELDLSGINQDLPSLGPDLDLEMLGFKDFILEPAEMVPQ